jgi:hypothetical protein
MAVSGGTGMFESNELERLFLEATQSPGDAAIRNSDD